MARYIDSDKLRKMVEKELENLEPPHKKSKSNIEYSMGRFETERVFRYCLFLAECEDVAPVVHAHWVDHKTNYVPIDASGDVSRSAFCSNCREWLTASDEYACRGNYCPNCVAKMDEEEGKQ